MAAVAAPSGYRGGAAAGGRAVQASPRGRQDRIDEASSAAPAR